VEINPTFAAVLSKNYPNLHVETRDAAEVLAEHPNTYDSIISTVPFGGFSQERQKRYFELVGKALKPGGVYIMIQYSLMSHKLLKKLFNSVRLTGTWLNIPPAFVYVCKDPL
jgi:phospholipid N-methyltransferase